MLRRVWKSRAVRRTIYGAVILAAVLAPACWYFGIHSARDVKAYIGMAMECHPVWRDLALRRVCEGQPVDEVIERTRPLLVLRHGRFVQLDYHEPLSFTVVQIVAMDGAVVQAVAGSCTWNHTFFDSMTDRDDREKSESFERNERTYEFEGKVVTRPPLE